MDKYKDFCDSPCSLFSAGSKISLLMASVEKQSVITEIKICNYYKKITIKRFIIAIKDL